MVRARFAPSPTGYLHIGNLRGILFNALFAKKNAGKFILRIEDTDLERSSKIYEDQIVKDLEWLGIYFDEGPHIASSPYGPYRQSERLEIYRKYIQILFEKGLVEKISDPEDPSKYAVKSKIGTRKVQIRDLLFNVIEKEVEDFILIKSNGYPTYHFACVVDDYLMKITHVIRGQDHLGNTAKHILLQQMFDWPSPSYAHYSLTLNLSKRMQSQSIYAFKERGYFKEGILNMAMLLGWAPKDQKEKFNVFDKIQEFDIQDLSKVNSTFDMDKFHWLANQHLKDKPIEDLFIQVKNRISSYYNDESAYFSYSDEKIKDMLMSFREQMCYIDQFIELSSFFFQKSLDYMKNKDSFLELELDPKQVQSYIETLLVELCKENDIFISVESFKLFFQDLNKKNNIPAKLSFLSLRYAITAELKGPELFFIFKILGYDQIIYRLQSFIKFLNEF